MAHTDKTGAGSILRLLRRRPLYPLAALALVAIALWGFRPRPMAVESATIARGPLTVSFTEEGRTRLKDRYQISAPLDGVVERIVTEPGDAIAAGDVVATLRPARAAILDIASRRQAESRLQAAESELEAARAMAASAEAEQARSRAALRRGSALAAERLIAEEDLEVLRTRQESSVAAARFANAQARAAMLRRDGERVVLQLQGSPADDGALVRLQSPVDGRLIRRFVESETPVHAGQALLEVGNPQALEVEVEALTTDAVRVRPGNAVRLLHWGGPQPLQGHVRTIEPGGFTKVSALGVEEQRTRIVVEFDAPPARALGDGFRVEAEFQLWHGDSVLQVPAAALFRDGTQWAAYAIENGRARLRHIQIGRVGENVAEIRSGLDAGAWVVLYPGDNLRDGQRVATDGSR